MQRLRGFFRGHGPLFLAVVVASLGVGVQLRGKAAPKPASLPAPAPVEMVPTGGVIEPSTTFALRFPAQMVSTDEVGLPSAQSPVQFEPPLRGRFVWLSQSSGVFTPDAPFLPGARHVASLRAGLSNRMGEALVPGRLATFNMPAFQARVLKDDPESFQQHLNQSPQPTVQLAFNAPVESRTAMAHLSFRNNQGKRIAAESPETHRNPAPAEDDLDSNDSPNPAKHTLIVRPKETLTPGIWSVHLAAAFPSAVPDIRSGAEASHELGEVLPLTITGIHAQNDLNSGRSIEIHLNKRFPQSVNATALRPYILLQAPAGEQAQSWTLTAEGPVLRLQGRLSLGKHTVTIRSGLPLGPGFALAKTLRQTVEVRALEPGTYLEAHADSQASGGRRSLRLLSVNNGQLRVRVKQVDPTYLCGLREGYAETYFTKQNWQGDMLQVRPGRPLSYDVVPGKTLYDWQTTFAEGEGMPLKSRGEVDVPAEVELDWDRVLKGRHEGLLFVEVSATGRERGALSINQAIIQLTDIGAVWKHAGDEVVAHAFSLRTGKPIQGATVQLLAAENRMVARGQTDATGLATMPCTAEARWIRFDSGADVHLLTLQDSMGEIPLWRFRIHPGAEQDEHGRIFAFTDRSVYRPGETLHLKGFIRELEGRALRLPERSEVRLIATDPRGTEVRRQTLPLSKLGSFDADLPIPDTALGQWQVTLQLHRVGAVAADPPLMERSLAFHVQEYQPGTYKIRMPAELQLAPGEALSIPLSVEYYFGKPLQNAPVQWTLVGGSSHFAPAGFEGFEFLDFTEQGEDHENSGNFQLQGAGKLDMAGALRIDPKLPANRDWPKPTQGQLVVRVTDINQQTLTAQSSILRHCSQFYLGLRSFEGRVVQNRPLALQAIAVGADGKLWQKAVPVEVTLSRVVWRSVPVKGAGNTLAFQNERTLETVGTATLTTVARDADPVMTNLIPGGAGEYLLHLRATDALGNPVRTAATIYVGGTEPLAWDYRNEATMELVADKPGYEVGGLARLLVKAPFGGRAWVSVEREKVLRSFQVELKGNAPVIEVPLTAEDAPNVFVSVCLLRGSDESARKIKTAEFRQGYCQLKVEDTQSQLNVQVMLPQTDYRPGQEGVVETRIADRTGKPVASAEVTLYAVDEGVLDLMGDTRPDPHALFYAPRPLLVHTHTSFPYMLAEDPARSAFGNKGRLIGGGGDGMGKLRENFQACAFWHARLATDATGRVSAKFKAPDGLTRYRVFAVAHTTTHQFGAGESGFRINKPLMIEAAWPRFARQGDRIEARAVVHNLTDKARKVGVQISPDTKLRLLNGEAQQLVMVPARGTKAVVWQVEFLATGTTQTLWQAVDTEDASLGDRLKTGLSVHPPAPLIREILLSRSEAKEINPLQGIDPQLAEATGTVTLTLSNTRLSEMAEAGEYLLKYPYGCVEQTTSALLPWLVLRPHQAAFPAWKSKMAGADSAIAKGIDRLVGMQTADGGLAYWPGGRDSTPWAGAYGGMGLAMAKARGHPVPANALSRLADYLAAQLRKPASAGGNYGLHESCLALYTLALLDRPEEAYHERWFMQRHQLSAASRAVLALAIQKAGGSLEMSRQLLTEGAAPVDQGWFGCVGQSAALQLMAWSHCHADSPRVDEALAQLMGARGGGHWGTTQGNAWAILALTAYLERVEGAAMAGRGEVDLGGQRTPFSWDEQPRTFEFAAARREGEPPAPIRILNPQGRRIYITTRLEMQPKARMLPRQDNGFSVTRSYSKVGEDGALQPGVAWTVGDLVCVTLRVASQKPAHFVVLDDALPAALEAVHPEFKNQQLAAPQHATDWRVNHRELRADRALYFFDHFSPGEHTVRYLARVRCAGETMAPSAKVEAMYQPQRNGLSGSVEFSANPLKL